MTKGYKSLNIFFSNSSFLGSYLQFEKLPVITKPEICFMGKSNVGKSTLVNKLTIKKKLAKTSKKPGCTRSINLFSINNKLIFADLPGYGFANLSKALQEKLSILINKYLFQRTNLKKIFLLIDSKIGIKKTDIKIISYLNQTKISFTIILTKIDKCSVKLLEERQKQTLDIINNYTNSYNQIYSVNSLNNEGIINVKKNIYILTK